MLVIVHSKVEVPVGNSKPRTCLFYMFFLYDHSFRYLVVRYTVLCLM